MQEHGLRVFAGGIVLHGDGRHRYWSKQGVEEIRSRVGRERGPRGNVTTLSRSSSRRLELRGESGTPKNGGGDDRVRPGWPRPLSRSGCGRTLRGRHRSSTE